MSVRIALVGNPNSGKTTLFNDLTGAAQYVGNWPGVTVEKKEGRIKFNKDVIVTDLPGIYSLSPYTMEEVVSRNYILEERPDVIINLVDASNIERNLYLTTQILELGVPVVIALNMMDVIEKRGDKINVANISKKLGVPVLEMSALRSKGVKEVVEKAIEVSKDKKAVPSGIPMGATLEKNIEELSSLIADKVDPAQKRWYAIKLLERDKDMLSRHSFSQEVLSVSSTKKEQLEKELDDDMESIVTNERYQYITALMSETVKKMKAGETTSDKIDKIVTNRFLALPIFVAVMFFIYYISISTLGTMGTDYVNDVVFGENGIPGAISGFLESVGVNPLLHSLIVDGIIGGVGAVLGFVPQIVVLYLLLAALEDFGYMARIAFIMDRIFRKFGLSGKSFIPMLIGTGCSIPGIMGTRTIEDEKDRRMTIIVTSFMPCSAKLPIIALVSYALFGGEWWVAPVTYFACILGIIVSGIMLKKTKVFSGDPAPFIMELPAYHVPSIKNVLLHTWERVKGFVIKAGTVILLATVVLWVLMRFTPSFELIEFEEAGEKSILAIIGTAIAPIFKPLGFGSWEATIATFTGIIAKEQLVSTFGLMTKLGEVDPEAVAENAELLAVTAGMFTSVGAFSFLLFNLFCTPCVAAVGAISREMNSKKWTFIALAYQLVFAYAVSFVFYQFGALLLEGASFSLGTVLAVLVFVYGLYLLFRKPRKDSHKELDLARHSA